MSTSAHRLHDLLRDVRAHGDARMPAAWGEVFDAEPGTAEFVRRHIHAVVLLTDTVRDIDALPAASRDRCSPYLPAWWRAVIGAGQQWGFPHGGTAQSIIDMSDLHHLANAGDLIEARLRGTSLAPADASLERLVADVEGWRTLISETDGLPAGLAAQLRSQLDHLLWLIDQAPRFGASAVVRQADETLGALSRASDTVKNPATWQKWKTRYAALVATIALLTAGPVAGQKMLEATAGTVRAFESNVHAIDSVRDALDDFGGEQPDASAQPPTP